MQSPPQRRQKNVHQIYQAAAAWEFHAFVGGCAGRAACWLRVQLLELPPYLEDPPQHFAVAGACCRMPACQMVATETPGKI